MNKYWVDKINSVDPTSVRMNFENETTALKWAVARLRIEDLPATTTITSDTINTLNQKISLASQQASNAHEAIGKIDTQIKNLQTALDTHIASHTGNEDTDLVDSLKTSIANLQQEQGNLKASVSEINSQHSQAGSTLSGELQKIESMQVDDKQRIAQLQNDLHTLGMHKQDWKDYTTTTDLVAGDLIKVRFNYGDPTYTAIGFLQLANESKNTYKNIYEATFKVANKTLIWTSRDYSNHVGWSINKLWCVEDSKYIDLLAIQIKKLDIVGL